MHIPTDLFRWTESNVLIADTYLPKLPRDTKVLLSVFTIDRAPVTRSGQKPPTSLNTPNSATPASSPNPRRLHAFIFSPILTAFRLGSAAKYAAVAWASIPLYDFRDILNVGNYKIKLLLGEPILSYPPISVRDINCLNSGFKISDPSAPVLELEINSPSSQTIFFPMQKTIYPPPQVPYEVLDSERQRIDEIIDAS